MRGQGLRRHPRGKGRRLEVHARVPRRRRLSHPYPHPQRFARDPLISAATTLIRTIHRPTSSAPNESSRGGAGSDDGASGSGGSVTAKPMVRAVCFPRSSALLESLTLFLQAESHV